MDGPCLGCGDRIDYDDPCPDCGWDAAEFRDRGRHGLAKSGHGEPEDEGDGERDGRSGRGPPPGPDGLVGF